MSLFFSARLMALASQALTMSRRSSTSRVSSIGGANPIDSSPVKSGLEVELSSRSVADLSFPLCFPFPLAVTGGEESGVKSGLPIIKLRRGLRKVAPELYAIRYESGCTMVSCVRTLSAECFRAEMRPHFADCWKMHAPETFCCLRLEE